MDLDIESPDDLWLVAKDKPGQPLETGYGMLAKYGDAPSAEEIDGIDFWCPRWHRPGRQDRLQRRHHPVRQAKPLEPRSDASGDAFHARWQ